MYIMYTLRDNESGSSMKKETAQTGYYIYTLHTVLNLILFMEKNFPILKNAQFSGKGRQSLIYTHYENS